MTKERRRNDLRKKSVPMAARAMPTANHVFAGVFCRAYPRGVSIVNMMPRHPTLFLWSLPGSSKEQPHLCRQKDLIVFDRNVPRPALLWRDARGQGAQYKMILHCREAPASGREASKLPLDKHFP
jgi:hypothetical protein